MEKLMMAHVEINERDLRSLASHRATMAREALLKAVIKSDGVFIVQPKFLAPEKKVNLEGSRVNFKVR